jgi:hypothetical protein
VSFEMKNDNFYFSITVRNSPFSKDLDSFTSGLNMMNPENPVQFREASSVLPYHGTSGNTGIVFCKISNTLSEEQKTYLDQFAIVYANEKEFLAARKESQDVYYATTPDPG